MRKVLNLINTFSFRLRRAVRRHGVSGLFRVAAEQIGGLVRGLRPSVRAQILAGEQRAQEFDKQFGVDTSGYIHPTELTISHPNQVHAVSYGASHPATSKARSQVFRLTTAALFSLTSVPVKAPQLCSPPNFRLREW